MLLRKQAAACPLPPSFLEGGSSTANTTRARCLLASFTKMYLQSCNFYVSGTREKNVRSPGEYAKPHTSSVFNDTEVRGWHTTLQHASVSLSKPAFRKKAEALIPPVCHLSCQECAKNKSLYTCSDGWSWPGPHVSERKAFCFWWSLIRWNCLLWMAQIFLRVIIGKGGLVPTL